MAKKNLETEVIRHQYDTVQKSNWFLLGLIFGVETGVLGNLVVSFFMRWLDNKPGSDLGLTISFSSLIGVILGTALYNHNLNKDFRKKITYLESKKKVKK